jgi:DNA polymerase-1
MKELKDLIRNSDCSKCNLSKQANDICLIGAGPYPCDLMIIGDSPGFRDNQDDPPISSKAGRILDIILEMLKLTRDKVYITNVLKCAVAKPSMEEIRTCRYYLMKEIRRVKPKYIISLGNNALKGIFDSNLKSISRERGRLVPFLYKDLDKVEHEAIVIPTYHPFAALKNKYYANVILEDIKKGLRRSSEEGLKATEEQEVSYHLITDKNKHKYLPRLLEATICSMDIETTGLDSWNKKLELVCWSISVQPKESFVFPNTADNRILLKAILSKKELLINHNIKFDLEWLLRYGISYHGKLFDTWVAKHLLDENYPDKSLKHLARTELNMVELSEDEEVIIQHRKKGTSPSWEEWRKYNGGDTDAAFRLYARYNKRLEQEGLAALMLQEMQVLKTLIRVENYGIQIDKQVHQQLIEEYGSTINKLERKLNKLVGEINLNSPKQIAGLLYGRLGLPVIKMTKAKQPSADQDTLETLVAKNLHKGDREVLKSILEYKGVSKLYTVYLMGLIKNDLLKWDGKIHCNFKIAGTVTGRLSCTEPNLQQIPRDGNIKQMFISSFKGGQLIQADYSQIELRILAHYANDKKLIQAFVEGRDIHRETAAKCLNKKPEDVTEEERKIVGKRVNFGIVYLIGAMGLADKLGCSPKKAQSYIDNWFKEFYRVKEFMRETKEAIIRTGKSRSLFGRYRRFYGVDPSTGEGREAIRQGTNSPIQGAAGDLTKYNMHRLDRLLCKQGFKSRVVCNVHDMIMVDSPKEEVEDVVNIMKELMCISPIPLRVPIEVEVKVGSNWNEMEVV